MGTLPARSGAAGLAYVRSIAIKCGMMSETVFNKRAASVNMDEPPLLEVVNPANAFERWGLPIIVFGLAIVVYLPSLSNTFVSWDDDHYIYDNRQLVHPNGLNDIWTNTKTTNFKKEGLKDSTHQYYPLLFTMFWVEHQIYHRLHDELLFSLQAEHAKELDKGKFPEALRQGFADHDIPIPKGTSVFVVEQGKRWLVSRLRPGQKKHFYSADTGHGVRFEDGELNIYSSDPAVFEYDNEAWGIHAVNTVLHGITVVVMMLLLRRIGVSVWIAWAVAALFAVHPMNVASVAWATERKNILSLLFYMLAMLCYLRHRRTGGWMAYLGTFVFFQGALFSKTVALTFPFVLFITDFLIDRRWGLKRFILRGAPLFLVAVMAFAPTLLLGKNAGEGWRWVHTVAILSVLIVVGVVVVFADRQLSQRLSLKGLRRLVPTLVMFVVALGATLLLGERWNVGAILTRFSPLWVLVAVIFLIDRASNGRLDTQSLLRIAPLLVMAVLSADTTTHMEDRQRLVPLMGAQRPFVISAAAWFYVLKLLVPIGQLPICALWNPYPLDPDRWIPAGDWMWWIPLVGVLAVGWALFHWRKRIPPLIFWGLGFYLITQLPMLGFKNINIFQFAFVHEHYIYNGGLGVLLVFVVLLDMLRKRLGDARKGTLVVTGLICAALVGYGIKTATYSKVWATAETFWLTILDKDANPECWAGWFNLGNQYRRESLLYARDDDREKAKEYVEKATKFYEESIRAKPNLVQAYDTLLRILISERRHEKAEEYCDLLKGTNSYLGHYFHGMLRARQERWEEAAKEYMQALRYRCTKTERRDTINRTAGCWIKLKRWDDAVAIYKKFLQFSPKGSYRVHFNMGVCYFQLNRLDKAEAHFLKAKEFRPGDRQVKFHLKQIRKLKG